ncbi:MAG: oligosaccharide flippase family protein [Cetobacterium sp.]
MKKNSLFLRETLFNYLYKLVLMGVGFISIPLLLNYLGVEKYGVWVTIMAVISWAQMSDFGIGNGLRNKITENLTKGKIERVQSYISTAYYGITIISLILMAIGILISININLQNLFNTSIEVSELKWSFIITIFSFSLNFVLGLGKTISYATHRSSLVGLSQVVYSGLLILLIFLLKICIPNSNLINVAGVYFLATTFANFFISYIIFRDKIYVPLISKYEKELFREIFGIGINFFVIQVCGIVLFSTDSIIITKILGPDQVSKYSMIDKLFSTITNLYSILLIALWSGVSKAYTNKDFEWIRKILKKLKLTLFPLAFGVFVLSLIVNKLVILWTGKNFNFDWRLILVFSLYTILVAWTGINLNVINGVGKLNLQLILYLLAAILNIPLSIFLANYINLGIAGVKLATLICLLPIGIFIPYQVKQILLDKKSKKWILK